METITGRKLEKKESFTMISTRDLKSQIDQLADQQQQFSCNLQEIKELLQSQVQQGGGSNQKRGQSSQGGPGGQDGSSGQDGQDQQDQDQQQYANSGQDKQGQDPQGQGGDSSQGQQASGGQNEGQDPSGSGSSNKKNSQRQGRASNGGQQSDQSGSGVAMSEIANDLLKFKDLTAQLEVKMKSYIQENSQNKPLSEEDAINMILNMMNGMIDWTLDFVSQKVTTSSSQLQ
jgi:hypothetical protein